MSVNSFPRWKNALIVFVLMVGALFALPNLYGDDPAVQITAKRGANLPDGTYERVLSALEEQGLVLLASKQSSQALLLRFADPETQIVARDILKMRLGDDFSVALNLANRTPSWLQALGLQPMKLGLDLRGGVRLLLEVDVESAFGHRAESEMGHWRAELRKENIRYKSMRRSKSDVFIDFREPQAKDDALQFLSKHAPEWSFESQSGDRLRASMGESLRKEMRDYAIGQSMTTLRNRVNELGVAEAVVQRQGSTRVVIELPGVQDSARAKEILGKTATLSFRLVDASQSAQNVLASGRSPAGSRLYQLNSTGEWVLLEDRAILTGDSIVSAQSNVDQQSGSPVVSVRLRGDTSVFSQATRENLGRRMGIVYVETNFEDVLEEGDVVRKRRVLEEAISAPTIQAALGKSFQITGLSSLSEAKNLALILRAGALPVAVDVVEERTIGPSLGQENIHKGLMSVACGMLLVVVAMAVYYRGMGMVANVALALNLVLLTALLSMISATLTLPGIAGIVLTLGMAVDANVLIFERIREELRSGTGVQQAIHAGYEKAFVTIVDANVTTLIAGLVLFAIGTGPVKGFAVTLSLGILTSMFTAVTCSRALVNVCFGGDGERPLSIGIAVPVAT